MREASALNDEAVRGARFRAEAAGTLDIEAALDRLPQGARDVVVLVGVYGHSHEEAADMLGIATGTSKAQLHRGRRLLAQQLGIAHGGRMNQPNSIRSMRHSPACGARCSPRATCGPALPANWPRRRSRRARPAN